MIRIKRLCLLLGIIWASTTLLMCSPIVEDPIKTYGSKEEILYWNISVMPNFFYPSTTLNDSEKQMVNHLYEGLTRVVDGEVVNGMAETINVDESGLIYTIELKSSKWSDGELVKADDFVYAWEREEHYNKDINLLYFDAYIRNVSIGENDQLVIELYEKNEQLLFQLSHVAFMPLRRDLIDLNEEVNEQQNAISNGPYYLSSYKDDHELILKRNSYYYDFFSVSISSIHVMLDYNYNSVYNQINNGELHFAESVDWKKIEEYLVYEPTFKIYEDLRYYGYSFNKERMVLSKTKMRELLFAAVDRTALNPFQLHIQGSLAPLDAMYIDSEKIKVLLEELDYGKVKELDGLEIVTRDNPNDIALGSLLAESWRIYLGIDCVVKPLNSMDYYIALKNHDYDVILNRMYDDSENKRKVFLYYQNNLGLDLDVNFDKKFTDAATTYDDSRLILNDENFISSYIFLPLFKGYDTVFLSEEVTNWSRSDEGLFYFGNSTME